MARANESYFNDPRESGDEEMDVAPDVPVVEGVAVAEQAAGESEQAAAERKARDKLDRRSSSIPFSANSVVGDAIFLITYCEYW